ncbi:MAG: cation diffusion facilitator family transporter [Defluviitaleaceae bacterium]|nr:cation diffusion facilitator family transporter [Defluviitaleaceae bacterium]
MKIMKEKRFFAVVLGAAANLLLFFIKLFIGLFLNSIAIISDAINNLTDFLSNFIIMYGIKIADKPADKEHPFGHGRVEHLITFVISGIILFTGFEFARSSISVIFEPTNIEFSVPILIILGLSSLVKLWLFFFYKKVGTEPLKALSKDSLGDVFITLATMLSIFFPFLDGFLGLVISLFIFYAGFTLAKGVISKLLGEKIDTEIVIKIKEIVEAHDKILGTHNLIIHSYGNKNMGTLHVEMPENLTIIEAHDIVDKLERDVKKILNIDLTMHIDPQTDDFLLKEIRKKIVKYFDFLEEAVEIHDFKSFYDSEEFDVILELCFPHNYEKAKENLITKTIEMMIKENNLNPLIEVEYKYHE